MSYSNYIQLSSNNLSQYLSGYGDHIYPPSLIMNDLEYKCSQALSLINEYIYQNIQFCQNIEILSIYSETIKLALFNYKEFKNQYKTQFNEQENYFINSFSNFNQLQSKLKEIINNPQVEEINIFANINFNLLNKINKALVLNGTYDQLSYQVSLLKNEILYSYYNENFNNKEDLIVFNELLKQTDQSKQSEKIKQGMQFIEISAKELYKQIIIYSYKIETFEKESLLEKLLMEHYQQEIIN